MKKYILIAIVALISLTSFLIYSNMQDKVYYVCTTVQEPVNVTDMVLNEGYKVIGRDKLLKPNPYKITDEDLLFILDSLPNWLKNNYPDVEVDFKSISPQVLHDKLKYEFTLLYYHKRIDGDFYTLRVGNSGVQHTVYIGKGCTANENLDGLDYFIDFYNEEWHKDYSNQKLFDPSTDLW